MLAWSLFEVSGPAVLATALAWRGRGQRAVAEKQTPVVSDNWKATL